MWHGFIPALVVSAVIIACGALLVAASGSVERAQERFPDFADAELVYRRNMRRLDRFAGLTTGATQRGSLPLNIGVILIVFITMGVAAILRHDLIPAEVYAWDSRSKEHTSELQS